jgi:predicted nucleotidyltransferase
MDIRSLPQHYRDDIETAANLLKREGCASVFLFGSMVTGNIHQNSDIDIGIKGLPPERFFNVYSKIYGNFPTEIHLVDFDLNDKMYSVLEDLGEVVQIG